MEKGKKEKTNKEIAEKYRFSDIEKMGKPELLKKIKALHYECMDLAAQLDVRDSKILGLEKQIEGLKRNKPKYSEYSPDLGGIEKVIYILKENARIMISKEIEEALLNLEPNLKILWENTRNNTSRYISRAIKAGRVIKHSIGNGYAYALPEWFNDEALMQKYKLDQ
jgi:hypothetical protein